MRHLEPGPVLAVRAIGGLHVVTLAWDFAAGQDAKKDGLLGFAIERSELDTHGAIVERYFLRGIKRFKFKDEGLAPGTPVPTSEHPIQTFQWGDYTPKPATTYRYRVVPVYGKPKLLVLDDASATTVEITTEAEQGKAGAGGVASHDIYFNRGAAGSQFYVRKFGMKVPDETKPGSEQMKWLSRGLFEALTKFIGRAAKADAADYTLRAMLYEFHYLPVGQAFAGARDAGADVAIRYEAQSYKDENEAMIAAAGIGDICIPQKSRDGIRHNKFIVLIHQGTPIAVWTGSTNISAGGIFGHSNVGHAIWDQGIAQRYLEYWTRLANPTVTRKPLVTANLAIEPTPAHDAEPPTDRYAVFDKSIDSATEDQIDATGNTVIAAGAKLEPGDLETFLGEHLTGFNHNLYIHDKFMLVDPLGTDPIVVTGSANFSRPSQVDNDENMVVVRDQERVADIYFGEFMRIFDHLYARYIVRKIQAAGTGNPDAGFLKEKAEDWVPAHFKPGRKDLRRRYFMGA